jgi:hypothetical protein
LETQVNLRRPAGGQDVPALRFPGIARQVSMHKLLVWMCLQLQPGRRIQEFDEDTKRLAGSLGTGLGTPEPFWLRSQKLSDRHFLPLSPDRADTLVRPLGIRSVAGGHGRGQPVLGEMVIHGVGLTPKSAQDAAALVAPPDGVWVELQGWRVADHGKLIIIKKSVDRKQKVRLNNNGRSKGDNEA